MSVRNFSQRVRYEKEDFQLPLTFHIGLSMDVLDFLPGVQGRHALLLPLMLPIPAHIRSMSLLVLNTA
jgi:hypothetical protein